MEEKELDGIKVWHFVAVLIFAVICTLVRAATEPPKPPEQLPKEHPSTVEAWLNQQKKEPLTDKEVEALVQYLQELE